MANSNEVKVAAFAGSLREGSYNRSLLRAARQRAPESMTIEIHRINDIPLYNQDVENEGFPAPVQDLKEAIDNADSLLIATPEYNHGVAGVTKNTIDWLSRPPKENPLFGKPVGIVGASTGMTGAARGQSQLRQAFEFTNSYCMPYPEILLFQAKDKFDEEGNLTAESALKFLDDYLEAFYKWSLRFKE